MNIAKDVVYHTHTKHIKMHYHYIKEKKKFKKDKIKLCDHKWLNS
jgi:hypothetical protein